MNKTFKAGNQGGFTLIELIVVIVILGILAATALPKFADLGGDARAASLKAAKGALASTAAMVRAKSLVNGSESTAVSMEGTDVAIANGYPTATTNFANVAGLSATDYTITASGTALTVSVNKAADPTKCQFVYTQAAAGAAPTYTDPATIDCK